MQTPKKIEISLKTLVTTVFLIIGLLVLWKLKTVILLVFISFTISAVLRPIIEKLYEYKIPKSVSTTIIYILFFSVIIFTISAIYRPFISQMESFVSAIPDIISNIATFLSDKMPFLKERFNWDLSTENIQNTFLDSFELSNLGESVLSGVKEAFGFVGTLFSTVLNFFAVIILSIYFIHFRKDSAKKFLLMFPKKHRKLLQKFVARIESQLGSWLRAQIFLMSLIGFLGWLGLEIAGINFSIPLGILAGLLEILPNLGPTITWAIATVVAIGGESEPWKIIFVMVWFILIQQFENYLIVPKLMEKSVGINPIITIISIISASELFGTLGALLAVPVVVVIQIIISTYVKYSQNKE